MWLVRRRTPKGGSSTVAVILLEDSIQKIPVDAIGGAGIAPLAVADDGLFPPKRPCPVYASRRSFSVFAQGF